jgi:hypothetical protein
MPAYLMEQLARYQREELTRQAERAQIRSEQGDSIHSLSSRLRLRRLRFKLRKTDPPVEIDLRDSGFVRETGSRLVLVTPRQSRPASGRGPQADPLPAKPST